LGARNPYGGSRAAAASGSDVAILTVSEGPDLVARLRKALRAAPDAERVVIHTAAGDYAPPLGEERIENHPPPLAGEGRVGAAVSVAAVPIGDTCKEVVDGLVRATIPRESLMVARGPWEFSRDALVDALDRVARRESEIRDLTGLCEAARVRVRVLAAQ